jgi:hypothetical protein
MMVTIGESAVNNMTECEDAIRSETRRMSNMMMNSQAITLDERRGTVCYIILCVVEIQLYLWTTDERATLGGK